MSALIKAADADHGNDVDLAVVVVVI